MNLKLLIMLLSLLTCGFLHAQTGVSGIWNGILNVPGDLHLSLHILQSADGTYTATLDSPDQHAAGIKCDAVEVKQGLTGTEISFAISKIKLIYQGKLLDDSTISGTFTQGVSIPLDLHRSAAAFTAAKVNRPQTPKPPFPYKTEEVIYNGNNLQYGGTLTIPQGSGTFPAVLLITGSGQQDRDETIFNHKPFAVLADALTRDGFVVLRVDDRGIGSSTGNFATSTTADFIHDVNTSVDYLKARPEVNKNKVGLLGHSEGGLIAPVVASQRKDIDFIVLLAAPGVKITDLMAEQNAAVLKSTGIPASVADNYKAVYKQISTAVVTAPDTATATSSAVQIMNDWYNKTDTSTLHTLGFNSPETADVYAKQMAASMLSPWFKYFMQFDPQPYLTNLKKVKVLALNGSKDIQVISAQNLPAIQNDLVTGKTKTFEVKEMPGLNHLFQTCNTCTVAEYNQLEETFSPVALQEIISWLNNNVK